MNAPKAKRKVVSHTVIGKSGLPVSVEHYTKNVAIKLMCTECCGFGEVNPKECNAKNCPLFPYRGKTLKTISEK